MSIDVLAAVGLSVRTPSGGGGAETNEGGMDMSTQEPTERGDVVDDGMPATSETPTRRSLLKVAAGATLAALVIAGAASHGTTGVAAHDGGSSGSSGDGGNDGQDD